MVANFIYIYIESKNIQGFIPCRLPRSGEKLAVTKGKNGCKVGGKFWTRHRDFVVHGWVGLVIHAVCRLVGWKSY